MAVQTIYILAAAGVTPNFFGPTQLNGSAPTGANTAYGWGPAKTAVTTPYYRGRLGATAVGGDAAVASSYNAGTSAPAAGTGTGASTAGDSFVAGPFSGTFAATAWTFNCNLRAGTAGAIGHINLRVWRSPNANGTAAVQLVANTAGTTVTLSTTADVNSAVTFSPGQQVLTNQYLFFQIEWQETTAGSSNNNNILFRAGTASITTADFVAAAVGTLTATQANQTVAATGNVPVVGTLSRPEINDTFTGTGGPRVNGTLALIEVNDTMVAAGGPRVSGTLNATQANQTISALGGPVILLDISGVLNVNQQDQTVAAAAPETTVTWGDCGNLCVLSNGNLDASGASSSNWTSVRANYPHTSGHWYFEVEYLGGATSTYFACGVMDDKTPAGAGLDTYIPVNCGGTRDDGYSFINGSGIFSTGPDRSGWGPVVAGDRIGVAVNCNSKEVYFALNGVWIDSSDPVTATNPRVIWYSHFGVNVFPCAFMQYTNVRLHPDAASQLYTPPSGFQPWNAFSPPPPPRNLTITFDGGTPREAWTGGVGMQFTLAADTLFNRMGFVSAPGFTGVHNLFLYASSDPSTAIASASIDVTGVEGGSWAYKPIPTIELAGGQSYFIYLQVVNNTSQLWYDDGGTTLRGVTPGTVQSIYGALGGTPNLHGADLQYVGLDLDFVPGPPPVGMLALAQAPQSFTGAAGPVVGGSLGIGQASHTIAASGAPIVSGGLTLPQAPQTLAGAGGPRVGGTLAAPQAAQTLSGTGTVLSAVNGTLALQQAAQTLVATGTSPWVANLALTEALDTISAAGGPRVSGTLAATEALDTIAATAGPQAGAALTANQAPQTLVAAGGPRVSGALSAPQAANTLVALGSVVVRGTLTAPQAAQTLAGAGIVASGATATLSVTQAAQTLNGAGTVTGVAGGLAAIEALDTINAAGGPVVRGTLATQQAPHTIVGTAASIVGGALSTSQAAQALVATGRVVVGGALNLSQAAQTIAAAAGITVRGGLSATQDAQTLTSDAGPIARGILAATEETDALAATGVVLSGPVGSLHVTQADHTLTATAWIEWGQAEDSTEPGWILSEFGPPPIYPPLGPADDSTEAGYIASEWVAPLPPIPPVQAADSSQRGYLSSIKGAGP